MASVNAALLLFTRLTAKLKIYNEHYFDVLLMSMTIILLSLSNLDQSLPDAKNKVNVEEELDKAAQSLELWVVHENVIGGPLFGGKVVNNKLSHPVRELEVCIFGTQY